MDVEKLFARNVRMYRNLHSMTQTELAEKCGMGGDHAKIAKLERGQRRTTIGEAVAIAKVFGVNVEKLIHDWTDELL